MKDLGLDLARAAHDPKGLAALKRAAKGPYQEQALRRLRRSSRAVYSADAVGYARYRT